VGAYVIRRVLIGLGTLLVVSVLIFLMSRLTGNPVDLLAGSDSTAESRAKLLAAMGLDQPLHVQYFIYITALLQGDMGQSYVMARPVSELIASGLGNTLQLAAVSFLFSVGISTPIGVLAAVHRNKGWDFVARGFAFFGQSLPNFWLGIMLILLLSVTLRLLPPFGKGGPETFVMPGITLGWISAAALTRLIRSSMLESLGSDYVRTARAKGLGEFAVLYKHALRNALVPAVAYSTVTLVRGFIVGSVVVETVFAWPGMGNLAYRAAFARDFPTIQGITIVIASAVVIINIVGDLFYAILDPRIAYK
jgi:peptide/nickel transport system permease protein